MDLTIQGTVSQILEEQSGNGKNGPWRKQDFILETQGEYSKPVCITQWGDKIDEFAIKQGDRLTAYIDIQSREFKGRWYTDVKAWRIEKEGVQQSEAPKDIPFNNEEPTIDLSDVDDEAPF